MEPRSATSSRSTAIRYRSRRKSSSGDFARSASDRYQLGPGRLLGVGEVQGRDARRAESTTATAGRRSPPGHGGPTCRSRARAQSAQSPLRERGVDEVLGDRRHTGHTHRRRSSEAPSGRRAGTAPFSQSDIAFGLVETSSRSTAAISSLSLAAWSPTGAAVRTIDRPTVSRRPRWRRRRRRRWYSAADELKQIDQSRADRPRGARCHHRQCSAGRRHRNLLSSLEMHDRPVGLDQPCLTQESRRPVGRASAAPSAVGDQQPILRARARDVEQPPLLLNPLRV
jgi:hypothetical protein